MTELLDKFLRLDSASGAASKATLQTYRHALKHYFKWVVANRIDMLKATYEQLLEYRNHLQQSTSLGTAKLYLSVLRGLYRSAVRWGIRPDNPAEGIKTAKDRTTGATKVQQKALSPEEAGKLWQSLTKASPFHRLIIALLMWQGLRAGEAAGILPERIDLTNLDWLDVLGKGNKLRRVYLIEPVREVLAECLGIDPKLKLPCKRQIENIVDHYLQAMNLKLKGRSAHALRHTYGLITRLAGASREAIAQTMGHADTRTTDLYISAASAYQDNPAETAWQAACSQTPGKLIPWRS